MSTQMELLHNAMRINNGIDGKPSDIPSMPGQKSLKFEDHDPFGGNDNNRRVAERVAKLQAAESDKGIKPAVALTTPLNPAKAAADVAESKKLEKELKPCEAVAAVVPVWKPNA